jgi:hypothetical protein
LIKHPRLFESLREIAPLDRPEWLRQNAVIGHALASNDSVLELLGLAAAEGGSRRTRRAPPQGGVAREAREQQDRPTEDYLNDLAASVLTQA